MPPIVLNTMPKSGSVYILGTLASSLSIERYNKPICHGFFPEYFMIPAALHRLSLGNVARQEHFNASPLNIDICSNYFRRMVLHVRDPRQATLSWTHHVNRHLTRYPEQPYVHGSQYDPPTGFLHWSLEQQISWHIERFFVGSVKWLQEWLGYQRNEGPVAVLVTTHDELVADERAFFARIVDFFDIPNSRFHWSPEDKKIENHFRSGNPNEWTTVFTEAQKKRCLELLDRALLERFGWPTA